MFLINKTAITNDRIITVSKEFWWVENLLSGTSNLRDWKFNIFNCLHFLTGSL